MYYYLHAARCTPDLLRTRYLGIQGSIDVKYCDMKKGREIEIEAIASSEPRSRANAALSWDERMRGRITMQNFGRGHIYE